MTAKARQTRRHFYIGRNMPSDALIKNLFWKQWAIALRGPSVMRIIHSFLNELCGHMCLIC